jgi:3-oxoacyl-[acyl-carrier protein] reductase
VDLGLKGKVALVTAASRGLGFASANALAGEGARVVICGRGEASVRAAEEKLRRAGADVIGVVADVTDPAAPARLVAETVERFGALDVLVANAGGPPPGRALDVTDEQIADAENANLLTSIRLVRESIPHMRSAGWGRICLITSSSIKEPIRTLALSNMARTGLWAWAKAAAKDVAAEGITINTACPGLHDTERIQQLGHGEGTRIGDPADFGRVVAFLCSQAANYVNGVAMVVDGGAMAALYCASGATGG